jgi:hypothetical protein
MAFSFFFLLLIMAEVVFSSTRVPLYINHDFQKLKNRLNPNVDYNVLQTYELNQRSSSHFRIFFTGAMPTSTIQNIFAAAAYLLESYFVLSHDVNIVASWSDLSSVPNLLGEGGPTGMCAHPDTVNYPYVLIPASLYVQLTGAHNCPLYDNDYHISVQLNSHPTVAWYFGVDGNTPVDKIDLVTVIMHEIAHGLGFLSGVSGAGGQYPFAPFGLVYDWYIFYSNGIAGWPTSFADPVSNPCISNPLLLSNGELQFKGTVGNASIATFTVYSPTMFSVGSSISHVAPVGGSLNRLMYPSIGSGQAWHDIGSNVWEAMATMGYSMVDSSTLLPFSAADLPGVSSDSSRLEAFVSLCFNF